MWLVLVALQGLCNRNTGYVVNMFIATCVILNQDLQNTLHKNRCFILQKFTEFGALPTTIVLSSNLKKIHILEILLYCYSYVLVE